jgi:hypothetical protein
LEIAGLQRSGSFYALTITFGAKKVELHLGGRQPADWGVSLGRFQMTRKKIAAVLLASAFALSVPAAALGAEHHPPKFGVHQKQCTSGANQPNCPGIH